MQESEKIEFKYWQDNSQWVGYLLEFPDYMTQGDSLEDLKEHLGDLYKELSGGHIPDIRRVGELDVR